MEPHNTTPENNLNTPPVGPMPEPLPPEPIPPAPVVPEPPEPEPAPAPAPAPTTPPSLETPIPTPENLNQKPATAEKPKKQGNPNTSNYIIAGVSVGVIAIIIVLICGAIFGGWFGGFAGGPISGFIFGTSSQSSSSNVGPYNGITEKVTKRTSDADSINRKAIAALDNALLMYQTNNRGQLPEIDGDSEYVSEYSDTETPVEKFYANYLDDENFVDEFGNKPIVWFYNSYDDFISDYDDEEDLNYMTEITVIYGAVCTPDGLEESTGPRAFAINIGNTDFSSHYCVDSSN